MRVEIHWAVPNGTVTHEEMRYSKQTPVSLTINYSGPQRIKIFPRNSMEKGKWWSLGFSQRRNLPFREIFNTVLTIYWTILTNPSDNVSINNGQDHAIMACLIVHSSFSVWIFLIIQLMSHLFYTIYKIRYRLSDIAISLIISFGTTIPNFQGKTVYTCCNLLVFYSLCSLFVFSHYSQPILRWSHNIYPYIRAPWVVLKNILAISSYIDPLFLKLF